MENVIDNAKPATNIGTTYGVNRFNEANSAIDTNNVVSRITIPPSTLTGLLDFSITMWVYLNGNSNPYDCFLNSYKNGYLYGDELTICNKYIGLFRATISKYYFPTAIALNEWVLISFIRDTSNDKVFLYHGNTLIRESTSFFDNSSTLNPASISVGSDADNGSSFNMNK